jgi:hypothetical protein
MPARCVAQRLAPPLADGVLVGRVVALPGEEPAIFAGGVMCRDVLREQVDETVSKGDHAL